MGRAEAVPLNEPLARLRHAALECRGTFAGSALAAAGGDRCGQICGPPALRGVRSGPAAYRACECGAHRLKPDPELAELGAVLGKGTSCPRRCCRSALRLAHPANADGARHRAFSAEGHDLRCGRGAGGGASLREPPARSREPARRRALLLAENGAALPSGYGHAELTYDFAAGQEADGWIHGLFRYRDRVSGHAAESSFGSHMFNSAVVYKNEPQSYSGRAPGLSTRLFLRIGQKPYDTFCHLIYPASTPWHAASDTALILTSNRGEEIARGRAAIPCSGSYHWRVSDVFEAKALDAAGEGGYVLIRDTGCRLFGYHGLIRGQASFALDHMFGF